MNRRLEADNPAWKEQQTTTLTFTQRLTEDALTAIVDRVRREGRMHRRIHDSLARATTDEHVVIGIDAGSLNITDAAEAQHVLLASGPAIVAAGYPRQALELRQLLGSTIRGLPRIKLTAGYAEYALGKYYSALGHIREATARAAELLERERTFLSRLRDACEFHVGLIDPATYQRTTKERAEALTGLESLKAQLEVLYYRCLSEREHGTRTSLTEQARGITNQILAHSDATEAIRLEAKLTLLYLEGTEASLATTHELELSHLRAQLLPSRRVKLTNGVSQAMTRLANWESSSTEALRNARELIDVRII